MYFFEYMRKLVRGAYIMYLKRLRDLREDSDRRQEDIAKILQISRPQYSLYETGKRDLPPDLICILADLYQTSTDYIFGRTNVKDPYPKIQKK